MTMTTDAPEELAVVTSDDGGETSGFDVVLRGYDRKQVEAAIERGLQGAAEQGGPA